MSVVVDDLPAAVAAVRAYFGSCRSRAVSSAKPSRTQRKIESKPQEMCDEFAIHVSQGLRGCRKISVVGIGKVYRALSIHRKRQGIG